MKQSIKVNTLTMAILDTAIKLDIKDTPELIEVLSTSMENILYVASVTTILPPKVIARIFINEICKSYDK